MKTFYATFTAAGGYDREKDEAKNFSKSARNIKSLVDGFNPSQVVFISEGSEDKYV